MSSPVLEREKMAMPSSSSSSSGSIIMRDSTAGPQSPQSLCVVVSYPDLENLFSSIVQLDPVTPEMIKNRRKRISAKWMAHFSWPPETGTEESLPWVSSTHRSSKDDLYILPDLELDDGVCETHPLYGAAFNCSTRTFEPIKKPHSFKFGGVAVTVQHNIYFIAHPSSYAFRGNVFERYNPATQSWKKQEPLPVTKLSESPSFSKIKASAVWDDTILLNIAGCDIWAYNVTYCRWYPVYLHGEAGSGSKSGSWQQGTNRCLDIEGDAFCVGNILYALSKYFNTVLSLFLERKGDAPDFEYSCGFLSQLILNRMNKLPERADDMCFPSRNCFPLGEDLCFVRTYRYADSIKTQPIQVSYIKLMEEGKMTLEAEYCYWVPLVDRQQFDLRSCFTLPYDKTTASKPYDQTFIFDPFLGTTSPGRLEQEKENVHVPLPQTLPKLGRSVIVTNLPPDVTAEQLEKTMKKFGHLERDKIQLIRDEADKCECAFVKFTSAAACRRAIKASPIRIGGCQSKIFKNPGCTITIVGGNVEIIKDRNKRHVVRV